MTTKRMMVLGAALLAVAAMSVQRVEAAAIPTILMGTQSISVSASIDDDGDDMNIFVGGSYGYFPMDFVQAGVFASAAFIGSDYKMMGGGVFGEYNFDIGGSVVPYLGAAAALLWWDTPGESETAIEVAGYGGARYFFVDYAAIGAELVVSAATEDMYNGGEDAVDWMLRVKTSWYY